MDSITLADMMHKQISEASSALQKGLTFYLAIVAATTGYLFSANLSHQHKLVVVGCAVSISAFTALSVLYISYGIWIGLKEMAAVAISDDIARSKAIFEQFIARGRSAGIVVVTTLGGILVTFLTGMFLSL